jgi:hypothetical protein
MRLLILGCSKSKTRNPGLLPASERYCGSFWKVVHRALRDCPDLDEDLDILVISAKFGAIDSKHAIPWYECRMTRERAIELQSQVVATINARGAQRHYDDALICLGSDYRQAIAGADLDNAKKTFGGIGQQARQLKQWLRHLPN